MAGRNAWSGTATKASVVINLPASASGNGAQFRRRLGFDKEISAAGWNVDTVKLLQTTYSAAPIDNDGDGLQNGYESANGLNPNNLTDDAEDNDGDGMTNLQEYLVGTDPNNASRVLGISQAYPGTYINVPNINLVIPSTVLGKHYPVEYKNDLTEPVWTSSPYGFQRNWPRPNRHDLRGRFGQSVGAFLSGDGKISLDPSHSSVPDEDAVWTLTLRKVVGTWPRKARCRARESADFVIA